MLNFCAHTLFTGQRERERERKKERESDRERCRMNMVIEFISLLLTMAALLIEHLKVLI